METTNSVVTCRTHRVGSVTAGLSMIVFGVLLLLHSMFDMISYNTILSLWPIILMGLGLELLLSNFFEKKIVYDKTAVFLLIIMAFFAIGMAVADVCLEATELYMMDRIY